MFRCPHCRHRTLSFRQKASTSHRFPAHCRECSGNSFVPRWWVTLVGTLLGVSSTGASYKYVFGGLWPAALAALWISAATLLLAIAARAAAPLQISQVQGDHEFRRETFPRFMFVGLFVFFFCGVLASGPSLRLMLR